MCVCRCRIAIYWFLCCTFPYSLGCFLLTLQTLFSFIHELFILFSVCCCYERITILLIIIQFAGAADDTSCYMIHSPHTSMTSEDSQKLFTIRSTRSDVKWLNKNKKRCDGSDVIVLARRSTANPEKRESSFIDDFSIKSARFYAKQAVQGSYQYNTQIVNW